MKPVEYQNILAVDHLEKGCNYISSKGEEVSCPVLENISFQIEPKEFVGIMGRSGCGKTTLLKVLGMLDKPEKGTVFYKGKDTKQKYMEQNWQKSDEQNFLLFFRTFNQQENRKI
ncbi:MAG: ATP-binding cassette domain-containing protein [Dorea longicatena]